MKKYIFSFFAVLIVFGVGVYVYASSVNNQHEYQDISFDNYQKKIKDNKSFTLYVYKTGCPACGELEPTLNKVIKEKNLKIYSLEMSKNRDIHKDYLMENNISSTPMLINYSNGKEDNRLSEELITEKKLKNFLNDQNKS
ncbi:thioredoxin family protein [Priestia megaterium]